MELQNRTGCILFWNYAHLSDNKQVRYGFFWENVKVQLDLIKNTVNQATTMTCKLGFLEVGRGMFQLIECWFYSVSGNWGSQLNVIKLTHSDFP